MTIIQNLACIQLTVNPNDHRIPFIYDAIKDKKINGIYLFCGDFDIQMFSPYNDYEIDVVGPIGIEDYFLNLVDNKGNHFVKDFSFNQNILSISDPEFDEITIDRVLDLYRSYLSYNISTINGNRVMLLLVAYQTENFKKFDDEINGSITVEMPLTSTTQDICLKDVIPNNLKGKKIKKIIPHYNLVAPASYLDLMTVDGKHVENLPVTILENLSTKEFYFDGLEIDVEKSYFRQRGTYSWQNIVSPFNIVIDLPKLTFIY